MNFFQDSDPDVGPIAADAPPCWAAKIYHASLKIGDAVIMGNDCRIRSSRREAFRSSFWALRFASWVDPFGIPWSINCEHPAGVV